MGLLRIAIGYPNKSRRGVPQVLAVGYDNKTIQAGINAAPVTVERIECGTFHYLRNGKRGVGVPVEALPEGVEEVPVEELIAANEALKARVDELEKEVSRLSAMPKDPAADLSGAGSTGGGSEETPPKAEGARRARGARTAPGGPGEAPKDDLSGEE